MKTNQVHYSDLPVPPGEYLLEVLREQGLTQAKLARRMGRPVQPINEIVHGKKAITGETALQIEQALGVPAHIWMSLEVEYRLTLARRTFKPHRTPQRPAPKRKVAKGRRA